MSIKRSKMPPVTSLPSEETDTDIPAFKILNHDNLSIVKGEAIFKPFGKESQKHKPNIMVYPTRRATTGTLEETRSKNFTKSNGHIPSVKLNVSSKKHSISHGNLTNRNSVVKKPEESDELTKNLNISSKKQSVSHGNLTNRNSATRKTEEAITPQDEFTKTLDLKLRKLQREEKIKAAIKKSLLDLPRKPFVTTVKKGQFLEPPPEYASLLGIRVDEKDDGNKLYAYASRPRIVPHGRVSTAGSNSEVHRSKCEAAAIAAAVIASGVAGIKEQASRNKRDINSNIKKTS